LAGAVSELCSRSTPTWISFEGLSDEARGSCLEAALLAPPIGSVNGLAEDQEPGQPDDDPGAGSRVVNFAARGIL
jgi:hypothetical protein